MLLNVFLGAFSLSLSFSFNPFLPLFVAVRNIVCVAQSITFKEERDKEASQEVKNAHHNL